MSELTEATHRANTTTLVEDKISAPFFNRLNEHSLECLVQVYNAIWSSGNIPKAWTSAVILPILKPWKPNTEVPYYRSTALTSIVRKICERMIANRISNHLPENKIFDPRHLAFHPFRDSHTTLTMLHQDIIQAKKEKTLYWIFSLTIMRSMIPFTLMALLPSVSILADWSDSPLASKIPLFLEH